MRLAVGLFGGTFDPVHRAHLELARRSRDQLDLDEVWWIPADVPPHKRGAAITVARHRVQMLRLALAGERGFSVCTYEVDRPGVHATVDTVTALRGLHPDCDFHLLLGEDSLRALDSWVRPDQLAKLCRFVVLPRGDTAAADRPPAWRGAPVVWLQGPPLDVSSSGVRQALREGREAPEVPSAVLEYARRHRLYHEETVR